MANAMAVGGPMDGTILGRAGSAQYEVVMADRTRWKYVATRERHEQPDGTLVVVYACAGRV